MQEPSIPMLAFVFGAKRGHFGAHSEVAARPSCEWLAGFDQSDQLRARNDEYRVALEYVG